MKWEQRDYQMPVCFFEAVGVCSVRRCLDIDFGKYWWGHRFHHDDILDPNQDSGSIHLTGIKGPNNSYGRVTESELYQRISSVLPLSIEVTNFDSPEAYSRALKEQVESQGCAVIPFPLCRRTAFKGMVEPTEHYAILSAIGERIEVFDQNNHATLPISDFQSRLLWYVNKRGYLPLFSVERATRPNPDSDLRVFQIDGGDYEARGRELLWSFYEQAKRFESQGQPDLLQMGSIWKIAQCRLAEVQYIEAAGGATSQLLLDHAITLAKKWNFLAERAKFNAVLPKERWLSVVGDLRNTIEAEEGYFLAVAEHRRVLGLG
jgi:hypothetical protein